MERSSSSGKIVTACFFTIWCGAAFGMGLFILQMSSNSGPFGIPPFVALMPFGMGIFGLVVCISVLRQKGTTTPSTLTYQPETIVYSGDYSIRPEFSEPIRHGKSIYQIPSVCPSCGSALSNEEVDWIGPLKAKCPYCNATLDAEERVF